MKRVILESPYAGFVKRNEEYARTAMFDCLRRGEAPFASHLLYTQCLDDTNAAERFLGINAGFSWREVALYTVFYCDFGFSNGMTQAFKTCMDKKLPYEIRTLWTKLDQVQLPQFMVPVDGKA